MSVDLVILSNHLILCCLFLVLSLFSPSIRAFSNELAVYIRWPKYWSFNFSICPFNEYSGFISSKIDWFDLFAVQRILKSLLQHHNSKASILWPSACFMVQHSQSTHDYWKKKKTALTRWTFVGKVMSLFSKKLSSLVVTFLPRSKCLLIS